MEVSKGGEGWKDEVVLELPMLEFKRFNIGVAIGGQGQDRERLL
jgi:hypothetical protein